ncbi:MAG: hypothetical protein HYY68_02115 [Thaumarchaeota archaeon]|nr:hypothetical protein [Nitrososphaerota archaeon]
MPFGLHDGLSILAVILYILAFYFGYGIIRAGGRAPRGWYIFLVALALLSLRRLVFLYQDLVVHPEILLGDIIDDGIFPAVISFILLIAMFDLRRTFLRQARIARAEKETEPH